MNKRIISNEEFIELWQAHKSAAKVAKLIGVSERNVHKRRREIEAKHDIVLVAASNKNSVAQAYGHINLGMENGTVIVFSDAHFQLGRRTTAFKALLWLIGELKPKVVIGNGDNFDGAQASRHPANGWDVTPTIIQELNACKMFLGEIQEAAGDAKLIWTLGNHDARFSTRLATVAPEFQGVEGFRLEDHFPDWQHVVSCMLNDSVMVKHRWKGGIHATHNNAVNSGVSFVTGHLHSLKVNGWTDLVSTKWGVDCGTLAEPFGDQFMYAENSPRNWRAGFAVLNIVDGHLLMPELCMVSALADDCVEWRGELIDVSEF
jgi:hypothetical protein